MVTTIQDQNSENDKLHEMELKACEYLVMHKIYKRIGLLKDYLNEELKIYMASEGIPAFTTAYGNVLRIEKPRKYVNDDIEAVIKMIKDDAVKSGNYVEKPIPQLITSGSYDVPEQLRSEYFSDPENLATLYNLPNGREIVRKIKRDLTGVDDSDFDESSDDLEDET